MNIVLVSDDNYAQHCIVLMTSLFSHNNVSKVFIVYEKLTKNNILLLKKQAELFSVSLSFVQISDKQQEKFPMPKDEALSHISKAAYYRLFLASLLPKDVDKIIYLDCDIIIKGSLQPLWEINIENKAIAACKQGKDFCRVKRVYSRLNYAESYGYFNSGVLLINLEYWRTHDIEESLILFMKDNFSRIMYHDQDVLNGVLYNKKIVFDLRYNMMLSYVSPEDTVNFEMSMEEVNRCFYNPIVVHYVSRPKPWEYSCNHIYTKYYYESLDKSIIKGWRPKFNVKNYWLWSLKPMLRELRNNLLSMAR